MNMKLSATKESEKQGAPLAMLNPFTRFIKMKLEIGKDRASTQMKNM